MIYVAVLRGGFAGWDGLLWTASGMIGMDALARRITDAKVRVENWNNYPAVAAEIKALSLSVKVVAIGYSGGGMCLPLLCSAVAPRAVDLVVGYDPSPANRIKPLPGNVKKAICYFNESPFFLGYGGGQFTGGNSLETIRIKENHIYVQNDERLHQYTLQAIDKLRLR